jgi:hypothetical protein
VPIPRAQQHQQPSEDTGIAAWSVSRPPSQKKKKEKKERKKREKERKRERERVKFWGGRIEGGWQLLLLTFISVFFAGLSMMFATG